MAPQEPEAITTASAVFNFCRTGKATARASSQKPELKAGWPQQAISSWYSILCPSRSRMWTMLIPTFGNSRSTKHGTNKVTVIFNQGGGFGRTAIGRLTIHLG